MNEDKKNSGLVQEPLLEAQPRNDPHVINISTNQKTISPSYRDVWPQIISSIIAESGYIQIGLCAGYSGVLLAQLGQDSDLIGFDKSVASWVASLFSIGHLVGGFVLPLLDIIGRKKMVLLSTVPFFINWMLMYSTKSSVWPLYVARTFGGIGGGLVSGTMPVYVSEIAHTNYRSMLLSLISFLVSVGMLIGSVIGTLLEWHMACLVFAVMSAMNLAWSFFIPESPYWVASFTSRKEDNLRKQVQNLNRPEMLFHEAWSQILRARQERDARKEKDKSTLNCMKALSAIRADLRRRRSYIPLILMAILYVLQQATGVYCIIFYSVNLFESLGTDLGYGINPYSATIALNMIRLLVTLVAAVLAKTVGRKPMLLSSCVIMFISCAIVALFTSLNQIRNVPFERAELLHNEATVNGNLVYNYIILASLLLYIAGAGAGLMVIPWVLPSELLPTATRATGNAFAIIYSNLTMFLAVKTFPSLVDYISLPVVFILYAVVSLITAVFIHIFLPETFRKTFDEISSHFDKRKHNSSS